MKILDPEKMTPKSVFTVALAAVLYVIDKGYSATHAFDKAERFADDAERRHGAST